MGHWRPSADHPGGSGTGRRKKLTIHQVVAADRLRAQSRYRDLAMILKSVGQFVMPQVQDLLDRQASGSFVGRSVELCSLHDILADEGPVVVYLHGIAGIGK